MSLCNLSSITCELKQSSTGKCTLSTSAGITTAHAAAAGHCCGRTGATAKGARGSYQPPGGLHAFDATAAERMPQGRQRPPGRAPRAAPLQPPRRAAHRRRPLNRPGPHGAPPSNLVRSKLCSTARNTCMRGCLPSEQPTGITAAETDDAMHNPLPRSAASMHSRPVRLTGHSAERMHRSRDRAGLSLHAARLAAASPSSKAAPGSDTARRAAAGRPASAHQPAALLMRGSAAGAAHACAVGLGRPSGPLGAARSLRWGPPDQARVTASPSAKQDRDAHGHANTHARTHRPAPRAATTGNVTARRGRPPLRASLLRPPRLAARRAPRLAENAPKSAQGGVVSLRRRVTACRPCRP